MKIEEFACLFSEFKRSAFRLETLQQYSVDFEQQALRKFLEGEPLPESAPNAEWVELVRGNVTAGKAMARVHLLTNPLTPYARFEIEWGYYFSAQAGEEIRFCFSNEPGLRKLGDFWLFDDTIAVTMHYGGRGEFIGPELVPSSKIDQFVEARDVAVSKSIRLQAYLAGQRQS